MQTQHVIIKPIISEKSLKVAAMGKYTFLVNQKANKTEIKKAIEDVFEVKVTKIMTNTTKGSTTKNTKTGRKVTVFANKKAIVKLQKGQSIAIFDEHLGIDDKEKSKKEKSKNKDKSISAKVTVDKKEDKKEDGK